jgi:hypothetical protein
MFANKVRAFSCEASATIKLGWKVFLRTNTLAYYKVLLTMDAKCFITLGPGPNVIKLFTSVIF